MAKRKKKHEPEMLIVSFCDIVTITTAALFFALLITVQEAVKVPVFRPTPRAKETTKQPFFFECRGGEVFYIDKTGLDEKVQKMLGAMGGNKSGDTKQFMMAIEANPIGNKYYKVKATYLLTAMLALEAQPGVHGDGTNNLEAADSDFQRALKAYDSRDYYTVFLVRDDSFDVFHQARMAAFHHGFEIGWELLAADEPIKFGTGGNTIGIQ